MNINPIRPNAVITHGTLMGFAFAFLFPLGAILIRTLSFRGLVWLHAGIQFFAYLLALAGLGLGVWIAVYPEHEVCVHLSLGSKLCGTANTGHCHLTNIADVLHLDKSVQRSSNNRHHRRRGACFPTYWRALASSSL